MFYIQQHNYIISDLRVYALAITFNSANRYFAPDNKLVQNS